MKLRYYLRGIGLGIIVAAAICMCATLRNKQTTMSDAEIKARAEELGMIDSKATLADTAVNADDSTDIVESPDAGEFVAVEPEEIEAPAADVTEEVTPAVEEEEAITETEEASESEEVAEPEEEEEPEEAAPEPEATGEIITIIVEKGNGSDTVAKKLAEFGLVSNAAEYDRYLMANGYDRRIAAGTHKIPKGASDEEIAKLLVSKQD